MVIVEAVPVPKGRPRVNRFTGKVHTPTRTVEYERIVKQSALIAPDRLGKSPTLAVVSVFHPIPKGWSKKKVLDAQFGFQLKVSRPDVDNLLKSALDGIQPVSFDDDAQVVAAAVFKSYSVNPRTEIELYELSVVDGVFRAMNDDNIFVGKSLRSVLGQILTNEEEQE